MAQLIINKHFNPTLINLIEKDSVLEVIKFLSKTGIEQLTDIVDDSGSTLLHYAVKFNNAEMILYLLHLGFKYDNYNNERMTPLMLAVVNNHVYLVEILIRYTHVSFSDSHFRKLLEMMFKRKTHPNIVGMILKKLCKVNDEATAKLLLEKKCLLYNAIILERIGVVKKMIDNGCSVNVKNPFDGNSPLHVAVASGNIDLVKLLVEHDANVNAVNNNGALPLNMRTYSFEKEVEILQILVKRGSLLSSCDNSGRMQIFRIFHHRYTACRKVKIVLQSNFDLNTQDQHGDTLIHYWAQMDASIYKTNTISLLSKHNFNPNIQNISGKTPLHLLARQHDLDAMKLLLKKGADVNVKCEDGPPLFHAFAREGEGQFDCVHKLIAEPGVDIQYVTNQGKTILDLINERNYGTIVLVLPYLALLEAQGKIIEPLRRKIDSTNRIKEILMGYRFELEKLKSIEIHESVTIFKLLTANEMKLKHYLRNKQCTTKLRRFLNGDPQIRLLYVDILQKRMSKVLNIIKWQQKAAISFSKMLSSHVIFPDLIMNEIFDYLSLTDMENLAAVQCPTKNTKKRKRARFVKSVCKRKRQ